MTTPAPGPSGKWTGRRSVLKETCGEEKARHVTSDSGSDKPAPETIHVKLGNITVTGGLSKKTVEALFKQHIPSIELCRKAASKIVSDLRGKVVFSLTIDPSGQVTQVRAMGGKIQDKELERCMIKKLRQLAFPAPHSGNAVTITVTFHLT